MRERLTLVLLFVACFSLATILQPNQEAQQNNHAQTGNGLALLLGDTRKMFANQLYAKADAYFHRGDYPSIFDQQPPAEENHMAGETHHQDQAGDKGHDEHEAGTTPARDWIESFGRHFYPTVHVHLKEGEEREMLPWLQISAELNPERVETYTVAAYWLRNLGKVKEAEQFLRQGLRANKDSHEILFELGRLYYESYHDAARARNVWELALRKWQEQEPGKKEPNLFLLGEIAINLSRLEEKEGNLDRAIVYLEQAKKASPHPDELQKQIEELRQKMSSGKPESPGSSASGPGQTR